MTLTILDISAAVGSAALVALAARSWLRDAIPPSIHIDIPPLPPAPPPHVVVEVVPVGQYATTQPPTAGTHDTSGYVQVLKLTPDGHSHVGYRTPDHPDVQLALNDPLLAVRWPDGRIESQSTAGDAQHG